MIWLDRSHSWPSPKPADWSFSSRTADWEDANTDDIDATLCGDIQAQQKQDAYDE